LPAKKEYNTRNKQGKRMPNGRELSQFVRRLSPSIDWFFQNLEKSGHYFEPFTCPPILYLQIALLLSRVYNLQPGIADSSNPAKELATGTSGRMS